MVSTSLFAQRNSALWLGGDIGIVVPSQSLLGKQKVEFSDVAKTGWALDANIQWYYRENLSLVSQVGFSSFPMNEEFWDVGSLGEVTTSYFLFNVTVGGRLHFNKEKDDFRPFIGVSVGGYGVNNSLSFTSAYKGTTADRSNAYSSFQIKPGFGPESGFTLTLDKHLKLYSILSYQLIWDLNSEIVTMYNEQGYYEGFYTLNPHGRQDYLSFRIGILYGLK